MDAATARDDTPPEGLLVDRSASTVEPECSSRETTHVSSSQTPPPPPSPPPQLAPPAEFDPMSFPTPAHFLFEAICPFMTEYHDLPASRIPSRQCVCGYECNGEPADSFFILGLPSSPHHRPQAVTVEEVWDAGLLVCEACLFSVRCGLGLHPWSRHPTLTPRDDLFDAIGVSVRLHGPLRPATVFYPARTMRIRVVPEPKASRAASSSHKVSEPLPRVLYSSDDDDDDDSGYEYESSATSSDDTVAPPDEVQVGERLRLMQLSPRSLDSEPSGDLLGMPKVGPLTQRSPKRKVSWSPPTGTKRVQRLNGPGYFIVSASDSEEEPQVLYDDNVVVENTPPRTLRLTPSPPGGRVL